MKTSLVAIGVGILVVLGSATTVAQTRGSVRLGNTAPSNALPQFEDIYSGHHALVIGVDGYRSLLPLTGAVRDAQAVSLLLKKRGFQVVELYDEEATERAIRSKLRALKTLAKADDRVIVYFAGHGISDGSPTRKMGYLMPINGDSEVPDEKGIPMDWLQRLLDGLEAKHVLFVADACYSGIAIESKTRSAARSTKTPDWVSVVTKRRARVTLTAGTGDQKALDNYKGHGLFTYFFLHALDGHADHDSDGWITTGEIADHLTKNVIPIAREKKGDQGQEPQISEDGKGKMIFRGKQLRQSGQQAEAPAWMADPPQFHGVGSAASHPGSDMMVATARALKDLNHQIKPKITAMISAAGEEPEIDAPTPKTENISRDLANNRLSGVKLKALKSTASGVYVMVGLDPNSEPYTSRPFALIDQQSDVSNATRKQGTSGAWNYETDCRSSASALAQGIFQAALQRGSTRVQSMNQHYSKKATKTVEKRTTKVMKLFLPFRSYAPGLSLDFKIYVKDSAESGEKDGVEFDEKLTEIPARLVLEFAGAQPWQLKFYNGSLHEYDDENDGENACQLSPALKRLGFRFRRVVTTLRDMRRVPRETYMFTLSGDPEHRGLDGEFYKTRQGRLRLEHKQVSDEIEEERWLGLVGAVKGKPMLNRHGYATARRTRDQKGRLVEVVYLDVSGTQVVPQGVRFARRAITYAAGGHKQDEAFFGVDDGPVDIELKGQRCQAYRWTKPEVCECKQAAGAKGKRAWVKCSN